MADLKAFRKIDEETYRQFKARAAEEGRPVGVVLNDAMRLYLES